MTCTHGRIGTLAVLVMMLVIAVGCATSDRQINDSAAAGDVTTTQSSQTPFTKAQPPQQSAPAATSSEINITTPPLPRIITPFPGVKVFVDSQRVELDAIVCIDAGWLEFMACSPQTKEHESLVVLEQKPSDIHAALLLAGFESGTPGRWKYENDQFELVPPTGSKLKIDVRYTDADGIAQTHSICDWVLDHLGEQQFPCEPWVFGGSAFAPNPPSMGGEHYVADMTGSIIGLATFGDEMIGYSTVISHDSSVQAPEWEAYTTRLPPMGTKVTLIIVPFE